jgi:Subtilase family
MPAADPEHAILTSPSVHQPGAIDRLNAILEQAGLGRPLGQPEEGTPEMAVVPVSGAGPQQVVEALHQAAPEHGEDLLETTRDFPYYADTVPHRPHGRVLLASGKKSGHGTVAWTPVPAEEMPPAPPWPPDGSRPVIAVLDSGVQDHSWLPAGEPKFLVDPPTCPHLKPPGESGVTFGPYWGHATFLAGLLRLAAPDAQMLSMKVMKDDGTVRESRVIHALHCLAEHMEHGGVLDVVLMAFGRPKEGDGDHARRLKKAISRLGTKGVKVVASAGNGGCDTPTIPAFLAEGTESPVVSVGAGNSEAVHANYSNHGYWVHVWRCGTDLISIMPMRPIPAVDANGYAQWSGTSFAAAVYAGELAHARAAERAAGTSP